MSQVFHSHTVNYPVVRTPAFKIIQTFLTVKRMSSFKVTSSPAGIYLFRGNNGNNNVWNLSKVNNKDTGITLMKSFWCLEQISYVNLVYIYNFEQVNAEWAENYFPWISWNINLLRHVLLADFNWY